MPENALISEIEQLDRPKQFEQMNVNSIVGKYLKLNSTKDEVFKILNDYGFSVYEKQRPHTQLNVDDTYLLGVYEF